MRYTNWSKVRQCRSINEAYINFFTITNSLYDECLPVAKIKLKQTKYFTPWITRSVKKSFKRNQKLYEKFLKHRTILDKDKCKTYKNLLESIKQKSKKSFFSKQILQYKNDMKKKHGLLWKKWWVRCISITNQDLLANFLLIRNIISNFSEWDS